MIKTIYICDWCSKEVTEPILLTKDGAAYKDMCICEKCLPHQKPTKENDNKKIVKVYTKTKKSSKASDAPKKKKLDTGKMQALRKAGWSFEDIADELHTTPGTVKNYLYTMKRKEGA